MCVVSNIGDNFNRTIPSSFPWVVTTPVDAPSREEFNRLKKTVEEMKELLTAAKKQDIEEGNPDCEMEEKVEFLRKVAKLVNIDLGDVFDHLDKNKVGQKRS
jgi:phosphoribosyl-ATP pyrophosphohydrolase